ncbi:hypothetical protein HDC92_002177 [Pedobacter sp. AK017]|uniref:hypothetical protein n=1 Tax=Pedobacter sp. AK017 TaxID=2723073 RepID=UPI00160FE979|nr:hypothetical protein [Pedobacter sp. AK017]MBB5438501.1 hypothetical protein [Pedobacter sp. AK017]
MPSISSGYIIGYHSCDKEVGLRLINGTDELKPSSNKWDWLGEGIYFWEDDPKRALQYAIENAAGVQRNKQAAKTPFVIGAVIDLGKCLNLVETESLEILTEAHDGLAKVMAMAGYAMPVNKGKNRALDCDVINYIHQSNLANNKEPYDSIRCAFPEGDPAFEGSSITSRLHIQLCIRSQELIKGYFLPKPIAKFNPNL